MSPRSWVLIGLFLLSEAAGVAIGEWFYHLYVRAVPPSALSDFNAQSSRIAHWFYGGGVGALLFVWALIGMAAGRLSKPRTS